MISNYNDIDALIGKDLSGEISPEEKDLLNSWLTEADENKIYYQHFETLFEKSAALTHQEIFDTEAAWTKVKGKIKAQTQRKNVWIDWRIAASIVLLVATGVFVYQKFITPQDVVTLSTAQQAFEKALPDGTAVFMNKHTSVSYEYSPIDKIRKTRLTGEAFFSIADKTNQEFLIEAGGIHIKDIGTAFNVKAQPGSDTVEVFVDTGEVLLFNATDTLRLIQKETGYYIRSKNSFSKNATENLNILAYKTQVFVFDNSLLSDVVETLNEVYDVKLKLDKKEIENCRITVTFKHETIDFMAEVIAETLSLTLEKNENEIVFKGIGCVR